MFEVQIKELDFTITKLIISDARYDIVQYLLSHVAATAAILVSQIELKDQAVRNFLNQLETVNFLQVHQYKLRDGRWIMIYHLIDQDFNIPNLVKLHLATRKKRERIYDSITIFILDVPFKRYVVGDQVHLTNEKLQLKFACSIGIPESGTNLYRVEQGTRSNEEKLIIDIKRDLRRLQKKNPTVLDQFLVIKE